MQNCRVGSVRWRSSVGTFFVFSFLLSSTALFAQLADDQVPRERITPVRESIKTEIEDSRWHLGPIYLLPRFSISNFGYNNNVLAREDEQIGDYTATVQGGVRYVVPFGRKIFLRGDLVPQYTWYRKLTEQRSHGGDYVASLYGLFNRMSVEISGGPRRYSAPLNSEDPRPVTTKVTYGASKLEVDVLSRVALFGSVVSEDWRYDDHVEDEAASRLGRDDAALRGGVRLKFRPFFNVSAAYEETTSDFKEDPQRDNQSKAVIAGLFYDRPRAFMNLTVGRRQFEPRNGSQFPKFSALTGSYYFTRMLARPLAFDLYGDRRAVNTLFVGAPYYIDTRTGAGFRVQAGRRLLFRAFGELGTNRYSTSVLGGNNNQPRRSDDVRGVGGGVAVQLYRKMTLNILASDTRYSSNLPGLDKSIFAVTTNLSFTGVSLR